MFEEHRQEERLDGVEASRIGGGGGVLTRLEEKAVEEDAVLCAECSAKLPPLGREELDGQAEGGHSAADGSSPPVSYSSRVVCWGGVGQ